MVEREHRHRHADMLSVEEARSRVLRHFHPLEPQTQPILECLDQTLAEDVVARSPMPPVDNAGMDGYALRSQDVASASPDRPVTLRVTGYIAAGHPPTQSVGPGTALRIMTGAAFPDGADAVVPFEDTDEVERKQRGLALDQVVIRHSVGHRQNVRPAGEDAKRGEVVLPAGTVLGPSQIAVLAALGYTGAAVVRRPVVAILATGDELAAPGEPLAPGMIYDSNSYGIAAAVARYGGTPLLLGIARDNLDAVNSKIDEGLHADLLITSAGVSKGDYDLVKDVLARRGSVDFWSVRMRPAKPLAFGLLRVPDGRSVPHLGLPGNPVSALVAFEQFARPAIQRMLGRGDTPMPTVVAVLDDAIENPDGRRVYARVRVTRREDRYHASLAGPQGSNILTTLARANGLAICPEDLRRLPAGHEATVVLLDTSHEAVGEA